jgi:hypothetical protein
MINKFIPEIYLELDFDQWFEILWDALSTEHYHGIDRANSLVLRFWQEYLSDPNTFDFDTCILVLHSQFVSNVNRFAEILLAQVQNGVTFTIWHYNRANIQNRNYR